MVDANEVVIMMVGTSKHAVEIQNTCTLSWSHSGYSEFSISCSINWHWPCPLQSKGQLMRRQPSPSKPGKQSQIAVLRLQIPWQFALMVVSQHDVLGNENTIVLLFGTFVVVWYIIYSSV